MRYLCQTGSRRAGKAVSRFGNRSHAKTQSRKGKKKRLQVASRKWQVSLRSSTCDLPPATCKPALAPWRLGVRFSPESTLYCSGRLSSSKNREGASSRQSGFLSTRHSLARPGGNAYNRWMRWSCASRALTSVSGVGGGPNGSSASSSLPIRARAVSITP